MLDLFLNVNKMMNKSSKEGGTSKWNQHLPSVRHFSIWAEPCFLAALLCVCFLGEVSTCPGTTQKRQKRRLEKKLQKIGGWGPTGKSKNSCAAGGCVRQCCSSRWGWRRKDVLLLRAFLLGICWGFKEMPDVTPINLHKLT